MTRLGPTRLVLINSGPYDYGEVALDRSGHLVGENNVGKTSLIAVLQFLYVSEQKDMHFAEDQETTRQFYFGSDRSFIVFEANTPEGVKCVLIQGLGPAQMHGYQRWIYDGPFRREHYIDGTTVRPAADIIATLEREGGARRVQPGELRQALTGQGRRTGVPLLGIVPVRQPENYGRFLRVFRNLIHLDRVRQHDLKNLFIEIARDHIPATEINLAERYGSMFDAVRRDTNTQKAFEHVRVSIEEAIEADRERSRQRGQLLPAWQRYKALFEAESKSLDEQQTRVRNRQAALEQRQAEVADRIHALGEEKQGVDRQLGEVMSQFKTLERRASEFTGFDEAFERQALATQQSSLETCRRRLYAAESADAPETVQRRLEHNRAARADLAHRLENARGLLAADLRQEYSDEQLGLLFRLANPALLGQVLGEGGVAVVDRAALRERLDGLLARIDEQGVFRGDGLTVHLEALPEADLAGLSDPDAIQARLKDLDAAITRDETALQTAESRQALEAEREELEVACRQAEKRLDAHGELTAMREQAADWRVQQRELEAQAESLGQQQVALRDEADKLHQDLQQSVQQLKQLGSEKGELHTAHEALFERMNQAPERFDWNADTLAWELESAREGREAVEQILQDEEALSRRVTEALQRIANQPHHVRFMGDGPEAHRLRELRERLDNFEQEREALRQRWQGLLKGLGQEAAQLLQGLDVLERECDQLNARIADLSISNLQGLEVRVERNRDLVAQLSALRRQGQDQGSFTFGADDELDLDDALERVDHALRERPQIRLADAYELAFDVTLPNGQSRSYAQLSQIQSNGTTVTIKVVINLLLLRGLLKARQPVTVPFYLDEVAALSPNNVRSILDLAASQDFVPILASPSELEAAEIIYLLRPTAKGRLVLTDAHRVEVKRLPDAANA